MMIEQAITTLLSWGLKPELGEHVRERFGYLAGTDDQRLADLNDAFRDPGVRAVIAVTGGKGAFRIAGGLDFDALRRDPKPVVGPDQIGHLHLAVWRECRLVGVHGTYADEASAAALRRALMTTEPITLQRNPTDISAGVSVSGEASGVLMGGNLGVLSNTVGLGLPSLEGTILLLEDKRTVGLGVVDRALTQLLRSGALQGVRAVALGRFAGFEEYVDRGWTVVDVLQDRLTQLDVPLLGGLQFGSGPGAAAIPVGTTATIDTAVGTLTIDPAVR
jgi:muramoyltetrapeptide carboxypeptidase